MLLTESLERLAALEPSPFPVISLYLNTQPDQHGRDSFNTFLRKELSERLDTYPAGSLERESLEQDAAKISQYLDSELQPSTNGVAIFASHGTNELFEAVQLTAPIDHHELYVGDQPHLYPLARLNDQYPRYAALVLDTNRARLFVFGGGELLRREEIVGVKTRKNKQGGWAQQRYQRHLENYHVHHVKEVVNVLEKVVLQDGIQQIIVAGDEVVLPLVREQFTPMLTEKMVDVLRLDVDTPERDVLAATLEVLRKQDSKTDAEKVDTAVGEYRARGLGTVGPRPTLEALRNGQVDELLIVASHDALTLPGDPVKTAEDLGVAPPDGQVAQENPNAAFADHLVTLAQQTSAKVTFIEDPNLLARVGGVAALLRFRL